MPNLTDTVKQLAEETQAVVWVGYRGFGSGGWVAGIQTGADKEIETIEIDAGTPMGAVRGVVKSTIQKLEERERKAASTASSAASTLDRLRARP